jgi:hypothetical protein
MNVVSAALFAVALVQHLLSQLQEYPFFIGMNSARTNETDYAAICRNFTCSVPFYSLTDSI